MEVVMNAFSHAQVTPVSGSKLDNRRALAALLDLALLVAGGALILAAAGRLGSGGGVGTELSAVIAGWALFYYFACESGHGQTLGKRLLKLRVVRADGSPSGMREILVRTALRPIDAVGGYLLGLVVMLITGERRQRLGDLAAGTIVVSAEAPAAPPLPTIEEAVATAPTLEPAAEAAAPPEPDFPEAAAPPEPDFPEAAASDEPIVESAAADEHVEVEPVEEEAPTAESAAPKPAEEPAPRHTDETADEPASEAMTVRSVETVSAIDLVMGADVDGPAPDESDEDAVDGPRS
jgi:uncharacterized RDD family membrane protein YckC